MKIIVFILLTLIMAAPLNIAAFAAESGEISLIVAAGNANAPVGGYVDVEIRIEQNRRGITGLGLSIEYDSDILERVTVFEPPDAVMLRSIDMQPPAGQNPFRLSYRLEPSFGVTTATGALSTVRFRVLREGTSAINIIVREAFTISLAPWTLQQIPAATRRGLAQSGLVPPLAGDVNMDGRLDTGDANRLRDFIAGRGPAINFVLADINEDGAVDILDLTLVRLRVAGRG